MKRFVCVLSLIALSAYASRAAVENAAIEPIKVRTFHVAIRDNLAYLSVTAGLKILDVTDAGDPKELSTLVLPQSATSCVLDGNIAYVAQGPAGVFAVDISSPNAPQVVAEIPTPGSAMMLDIANDVLAVADGSVGLSLFDVSNPAAPKKTWSDLYWDGYVRGVEYYQGHLYVCAGKSGVAVFSVSEEGDASRVGITATAGDARDIAFYRGNAYVADGKSGVSVLDITDPTAPKLTSTSPTQDLAHGVAFHKGYVFVADGLSGVGVFKFDKSSGLEHVQQLDTLNGYANKVAEHDRKLFVSNDYKGMLAFDIRRPDEPKLIE